MLALAPGQLEAWVAQAFFPFVRIGACLMVAPIFGAQFLPARARLLLAVAVTALVLPLLPPVPVKPLSVEGVVITIHQVLIGAATGFVLMVAFDALAMGGQLLANGMGLGFAFNVDPLRGTGTAVLGQFYMVLVTLTFLALDGHVALIATLVDGFQRLPVTAAPAAETWWTVAAWGTQLFAGALRVALPGMTALLVANLAFGVVSRAAPTLNLFAVGFPAMILFGLVIVLFGLPAVQAGFVESIDAAFALLGRLGTPG
ncbi:MAG: flagellar biosynthetic protein FliR [Burkholderiaceae bacterium]|nr:flagellar biosynthetic protein FliR [Burkholderiaceae bacterium]